MTRWPAALIASLVLTTTPAMAAECQTEGVADAPIAFPRNDESDVPFARSMVEVILPHVSGALPRALNCTRSTVSTALGDYTIGGENGDDFPRMAMRADGQAGPVAYLAASPATPGIFALVVYSADAPTVIKRFYEGIPTDRRLADDIRAALADEDGIMAFDAKLAMVLFGFGGDDFVPPPVEPETHADGSEVAAGPQILIADSGDIRLLDMADDMRHKPSGFACPSTFDGLAVLLMTVDPRADSLSCSYRAGTELRYRQDDPMRYHVELVRAGPADSPRGLFDQMTASGRAALAITGDHTVPLATGPAPAPELAVFWDTENDGVQGLWVGKAGGWIVLMRAQYPPSSPNDVEAGKVAQAIFTQTAEQVR